MKALSYIFISFIFLVFSCSRERNDEEGSLLNVAERLLAINVDSASWLLDSISTPDGLDDKDFARWCMLQGKIVDKLHSPLPAPHHYNRAAEWYSSHGTAEEQAQILLYLGRSYAEDGAYDEAMAAYTVALDVAEKNQLDNIIGYINSYMGDMYEDRAMWMLAIDKYKVAAEYFSKARNVKSHVCALRDIGREYAKMDSISCALATLSIADSIANALNNWNLKADIANHIGNAYFLQEEYEKAKEYFYTSLKFGTDTMPDYIALISLYLETDSLHKAKKLLEGLLQYNPEYTYSIKNLYYEMYKREGQYDLALENLEEYKYLTDSLIYRENQSKILNIDKKYNDQKKLEEINRLTNSRRIYFIISIVCILGVLVVILAVLLYRKWIKGKFQKQQIELSNIKNELLNLSLELEKKKSQLSTIEEEKGEYQKMKGEVASLALAYRKLQHKLIVSSPTYKELIDLANQNKSSSGKSLVTDRYWQRVMNEITTIYPSLRAYVFNVCPEILDQEWQYCCFFMYGFDVNTEARLLNINPASVYTKHLRLKEKLGITLPTKTSLHDYLVEKLL